MIVYKVVQVIDEQYWSSDAPSRIALTYKVNKTTRPKIKGSLLFAFSKLEDAKAYAKFEEIILECKANPTEKVPANPSYLYGDFSEIIYQQWWEGADLVPTSQVISLPVPSCVYCTEITPLRIVPQRER